MKKRLEIGKHYRGTCQQGREH
jgi:hypothetical protein